ncbi:phthiocerol/phenolphthiocerol synthesis type-I polyketide synthase D [Actinopolyspora biskrensis]|uniref:Phthiocerol/phenolphthiocerol synthesis type-I polyketide synthase D n=1 Tax=Actinopolyspora biskrensis TaxID=1470178 RepID=A0A852YZ26_9ACTN|nr:type I polyketide synthase [Actinopolyspora biskrensis]NYH78255.1 phthiocerol/phenolphthiocerol synthesis type-I polyketide synthase D [Actinopolyspora biskrensis]
MIEHSEIREWLVHRIAEHTGQEPERVDTTRPFDEFGLSSRDVVGISGELENLLGRGLSATLLWEFPTVERLAEALEGTEARPGGETSPEPGEPVAVVGLGCRFPGVDGPEEFWRLLDDGADTIGTVPAGRWEQFAAGQPDLLEGLPRAGGYFDDVSGFDAGFFEISPREAEVMDPQQRLLLEVAWEALEHAGSAPSRLRGSATGVFVGASATEYSHLTAGDIAAVDAWTGTGGAMSVIANRISYLLDLRGPSMAVDTACSSSLVALHQACASLRSGESSTALACGVNLLLSPAVTANFASAGALAPDGRCKPFDAAADGIVRGEGCGAVVLKPLSAAARDGDRIHAVIRGSAVNSDGRSNGLMAPNPAAQAELLRTAYGAADLDPTVVDYVEAHGTGTLLGDPIEAQALGSVLGAERGERRPVLLGSVKANLGHLEAAAGIAGVIKVVLAMRHGRLPATPNHTTPNPHIPLERDNLEVVGRTRPWPRYSGAARAGVSGFGFGGTNAHVVLESWEAPRPDGAGTSAPHTFLLSGSGTRRLCDTAGRLADWLRRPAGERTPLGDVARTLLHGRQHHAERAAVVTDDRSELAERLRSLAAGETGPGVLRGRKDPGGNGPVWVFSGYGSQWPGMCRGLVRSEPAFAGFLEEHDAEFRAVAGFSLLDALSAGEELGGLYRCQLGLFGTQLALARLWRSRGVRPSAVIGHSMGEVAAAVAVGSLEHRQGLEVMDTRTRLLSETELAGGGAMAALEGSAEEVEELSDWFPGVVPAVRTSSRRCTVAGPADEIELIAKHFRRRDRTAKVLDVSGAGHTAAVEPLLERLRAELAELTPSEPDAPVYSTAHEDPRALPLFDGPYWARNLRSPVRLDRAVHAAAADGFDTFLEIAPHPIVSGGLEESLTDAGVASPRIAFSCLRDTDDTVTFRENLARLWVDGHVPEQQGEGAPPEELAELPPAAWRHESFWVSRRKRATGSAEHPLLGERVELPTGQLVWRGDVGTSLLPWLGDHRVHGTGVLAGSAYLEMALTAALRTWRAEPAAPVVRELELSDLLVLSEEVAVTTVGTPHEAGVTVEVFSRSASGEWTRHAAAEVVPDGQRHPGTVEDESASAENVEIYRALRAGGQDYGPAFRPIETVRARAGRAAAELALPDEAGPSKGFRAHPALVDGCLQSLVAAALAPESPLSTTELFVPVLFRDVRVFDELPERLRCSSTLDGYVDDTHVSGSVLVTDERGRAVLEIGEVRARRVGATPVPRELSEALLRHEWEPARAPERAARAGKWLLLGDLPELAEQLRRSGERVSLRARLDDSGTPEAPDELTAAPELPFRGVVLAAHESDPEPAHEERQRSLLRLSELVRWSRARPDPPERLWILSSARHNAELRALVRVLALEAPGLRVSLVEGEPAARSLAAELCAEESEDDVRWVGEQRHVARLRRGFPDHGGAGFGVRPEGYVITGGLGGLGLTFAHWLVDRGARRVVLNGRGRPSPAAERQIELLRDKGAETAVVHGDIAEPGVAERLVTAATEGSTALRGVLHAAGVLADAECAELDGTSLERVWRPKVRGGQRLHEATEGVELDWWVAFSSAAALLGSPGQTAYAAANGALDDLVRLRRERGLVATSVQWGVWGEVGAAGGNFDDVLPPLSTKSGVEAFEKLLAPREAVTGLAWLNGNRAAARFPELGRRPFFRELVTGASPRAGEFDDAEGLSELPPEEALERLTVVLTELLGAVCGTASGEIDADAALTELGFDSLMAMRARNAVESRFGVSVPAALLLRGASTTELAVHLANRLGVETDGAPATGRTSVGPRDATERWIAHLWRQALGLDAVGVDRDFRSVGGDDSAAAEISAAVGERLGEPVPGLFEHPTIERMSDLVRERFESAGGPVRELRSAGGATPLFLFHPAGGPTSVYQPLTELLGADQPCYGLERLDRFDTVEDKASEYLSLIRGIQPHGPYRLGGWSFGGCLAFETARRIEQAGERVELVVLIDTILPLPSEEENRGELVTRRFGRFVEHVEHTYGVSLGISVERLAESDEREQLEHVMNALAESEANIGHGVLRHQYTSYVDARIAERYRPANHEGPVVLYRAERAEHTTTKLDPRYLRSDETLGWDEFASALEVVRVPGDHLSMIDPPNVERIAEHLRGLLGDGGSGPVRE